MSAESYYELITPERFSETMKKRLKETYEKLTEDYLYNYNDDFKMHPYPERMDFSEWGEPEKHGESDVCFSGTDCLSIVDHDYIRIFFDEIAKSELLMPFDFRISFSLSEGHFKMHVRYRGDGLLDFIYFDTLNSGGDCSISCPNCGCLPDFDMYPDWFDDDCPNCGESLDIDDSVDYNRDYSYDFFAEQFYDRLGPFDNHEVHLTNDATTTSGTEKSFLYTWNKHEEKPPIPEKRAHVVLLASSPIDRGILSPFEFVYEDQITDKTDLIIIGTDCRCYYDYDDYRKADLSKATCSSPDTSDIKNWSIDGKPVNDLSPGIFVDRGDFNIEKAISVLDLLESFYNNGGQIPFVILRLW